MRQIDNVLKGYADRVFMQQELAYYNAWHAGVFSQPYKKGRFPKYDSGKPRRGKRERQTWQQQKMIARTLNALYGGEVKTHGH